MELMTQMLVALTNLEIGEGGAIAHIALPPNHQQFLTRIGIVPGAEIKFSRRAPLGDPSVYSVDGTEVALRAETASYIFVQRGHFPRLGDMA
jgi:Fe2+ transport system protein FeoA